VVDDIADFTANEGELIAPVLFDIADLDAISDDISVSLKSISNETSIACLTLCLFNDLVLFEGQTCIHVQYDEQEPVAY